LKRCMAPRHSVDALRIQTSWSGRSVNSESNILHGTRLTSHFDFGDRFLDHTWWFVWPVARCGIVDKAYAEYEVFAFADLVIIVVDL
jgi:hypothetical protein